MINRDNNEYPLTIDELSDYFICYLKKENKNLTVRHLQCLLYLCQCYYLASYDKPLFQGQFKAGIFSPSNSYIYDKYKYNDVIDNNINLQELKDIFINKGIYDFVTEFTVMFTDYTYDELFEFIKRGNPEQTPYIRARQGYMSNEFCDKIISENDMRIFYKEDSVDNIKNLYGLNIDINNRLSNIENQISNILDKFNTISDGLKAIKNNNNE